MQDRQAVGQPGIELADQGDEGVPQPGDLVRAEPVPPALLNEA